MIQPDAITSVGRAVRAYRQRRGLSQSDLAVAAGIDRKTVNRIEQGRHSMRVSTLFELADALGIEPKDLVAGHTLTVSESRLPDVK